MQGGVTAPSARARQLQPTPVERVGCHFDVDAVPTGVACVGDTVFAGFGDGHVRIFRPGPTMREVPAHRGALLCLAPRGTGLITGGDDGRVLRLDAEGSVEELADHRGGWVDCLASAGDGAWAASVGRTAYPRDGDGRVHALGHPSTVGGLAFDREGKRLAVAHYGGVTIWTRGRRGWKATSLKWRGSHGAVTWSPDNRFVVTTMQENALHGWRLRDKADMRMTGYPFKVKSMDWVGQEPFLATSGAEQAICWPFDGPNGPMGRAPLTLGDGAGSLVTAVARLPGEDGLLIGFDNGLVLGTALDVFVEPIVIRQPRGAAISHLIVTPDSGWMLAAAEDGQMLWAPLGRSGKP